MLSPHFGRSLCEVHDPRSHGISANDMKKVMCCMQYVICYMQDGMCCLQYNKYDDACYSHGMTFLIQIWKVH